MEELLEQLQKSRARPDNISYFAFTGTPKAFHDDAVWPPTDPSAASLQGQSARASTATKCGRAIEEGFILDVLLGYVPYKTRVQPRQADRGQQTGERQGRQTGLGTMDVAASRPTSRRRCSSSSSTSARTWHTVWMAKAKAMVVTSSRAAAIRYKKAFDAISPNTRIRWHSLIGGLLRQDDRQAGDAWRRRAHSGMMCSSSMRTRNSPRKHEPGGEWGRICGLPLIARNTG